MPNSVPKDAGMHLLSLCCHELTPETQQMLLKSLSSLSKASLAKTWDEAVDEPEDFDVESPPVW